jgi:oxalate decarboxylase
MSSHLFRLDSMKPQYIYPGGKRVDCNADLFPVLSQIALSLLTLEPKGVRIPHWHPNAHELSYCIEGNARMTIFGPRAVHSTFTISSGDIAFVPMGYMHQIENIGDTPVSFLLCFSHERPEELEISSSIWSMPAPILAHTFQVSPSFFTNLPQTNQAERIIIQKQVAPSPLPTIPSPFKYALDSNLPQIDNKGGWVKMSNGFLLPPLESLAVYSLLLKPGGAREPHWHPNADELNYLIQGTARITLVSPHGNPETFDLSAGDLSFMPKGYLHHIENTGQEEAHFAVFFNHNYPSDIGISGCMGAYSNEILATIFGVESSYFDSLPKYQEDLLIVAGGG